MPRLLIVDDESAACQLVQEMLSDRFDDISIAENGKQAMAEFQKKPADLVVTDLIMPEKNGIDFILELKQEYPDVRIIAMSGGGGITGRFEYLPIAKMIGAAVILDKPFSTKDLCAAVDTVMGK